MELIYQYAPNTASPVRITNGDLLWHEVTSATFPNLGNGGFLSAFTAKSITSADADGSPFEIAFNQPSAPAIGRVVTTASPLSEEPIQFGNLWLKLTVSTDIIELTGRY